MLKTAARVADKQSCGQRFCMFVKCAYPVMNLSFDRSAQKRQCECPAYPAAPAEHLRCFPAVRAASAPAGYTEHTAPERAEHMQKKRQCEYPSYPAAPAVRLRCFPAVRAAPAPVGYTEHTAPERTARTVRDFVPRRKFRGLARESYL